MYTRHRSLYGCSFQHVKYHTERNKSGQEENQKHSEKLNGFTLNHGRHTIFDTMYAYLPFRKLYTRFVTPSKPQVLTRTTTVTAKPTNSYSDCHAFFLSPFTLILPDLESISPPSLAYSLSMCVCVCLFLFLNRLQKFFKLKISVIDF